MSVAARTRVTEYSKAASRGNWQDVWAGPIVLSPELVEGSKGQRQRAKGAAANEAEDEGPGLFGDAGSAAGVAAE